MALLYLLEYALIGLLLLLIFTQIFIPIFRGTLLFPFFHKERYLENQLQAAKQNALEAELEKQALKTEKQVPKTEK